MIAHHKANVDDAPLNRPSGLVRCWNSQELQDLFLKAQSKHSEGKGLRPLPPDEATTLIVDGKYEEAVRGLSFILSGRDLLRATQRMPGSSFNDALEKIANGCVDVSLSRGQLCVARMVRAIRVFGLDSSTHAGDRAISLVQPYQSRLEKDLAANQSSSLTALSHRLIGTASLIAAQASRDSSAQPCGVQVVRAARERDVPCIMISSHHALGGDALPLVAEHCAREGLLNGNVSCQRLGFTNSAADIFWVFKQDPTAWVECFNRLGDIAAGRQGGLLVVQDTVGSLSDDLLPFPIEDVIREAYLANSALRNHPLSIVPDKEQAMAAFESSSWAAVATDLFMPTCTGSTDKSCGEATVREVLLPYLEHSDIDLLIRKAQAAEEEVCAIVNRELAELLLMS